MPQAPRRGARDVVAALTVVEGSGFGVFGRPGGMRWTAGIEKKASLLFSRGKKMVQVLALGPNAWSE